MPLTHERGADERENTPTKIPRHVVSELRHQSTVHEGEEHDHDDERQYPDASFQRTVTLQTISTPAIQGFLLWDLPL